MTGRIITTNPVNLGLTRRVRPTTVLGPTGGLCAVDLRRKSKASTLNHRQMSRQDLTLRVRSWFTGFNRPQSATT